MDGLQLTHKEIDQLCFVLMLEIERCEMTENSSLHHKDHIPEYRALYKKINQYGMQKEDEVSA